jgi:integrating conjugative element protein (TIGR03757 family)
VIAVRATMVCLALAGAGHAALAQQPARINSTQIGTVTPAASLAGFVPAKVEVFATNSMFVSNAPPGALIYRVDDRQKLEADLTGNGLPADRTAAQRIVMQRVQQMGKQAFDARIRNAMAAVQQSVQLGIDRVPAVVFDGRYAVFGVTDVAHALAITRRGGALAVRARFKPAPPVQKKAPSTPAYLQPQGVRQLPPLATPSRKQP